MSELELLRWDAPGPYEVVFSTRLGGISEGKFSSLNLALGPSWWDYRDDPERVGENRRRLCAAVGADSDRLALNVQRHTATANAARSGGRGEIGDALWTEEPRLPMLALGADCLLVALVRANGNRPGAAVLHAGRIGLLAGIVEAGVRALGGSLAAAIGPGIGPCCYEVGEDVGTAFQRRFGPDVVHGRRLDLWTAAERALREAGVGRVDRLDLCTACDERRFFSYRRDGKPRGGQGVIAFVG